jgi:hypothetical protein
MCRPSQNIARHLCATERRSLVPPGIRCGRIVLQSCFLIRNKNALYQLPHHRLEDEPKQGRAFENGSAMHKREQNSVYLNSDDARVEWSSHEYLPIHTLI